MKNFEFVNCPVCNNNVYKKKFNIQYGSNKVLEILDIIEQCEKVEIYKCKTCGHCYSNPQVNEKLLEEYYSKLNSEYYKLENEPIDDKKIEEEKIVKILEKYKNGGNLLEVGCGYGFFLNKLDRKKWNPFGIEPSIHAANFGIKNFSLDIKQKFLELNDFEQNFFDAIVISDVIEHLRNPNQLLGLFKYFLKTLGILLIKTGNINSIYSKICGRNWGYYGSWEHISFYSPKSIKYLLDKHSFNLKKIFHTSHFSGIKKNIHFALNSIFIIGTKNLIKKILNKYFNKNYKTEKFLIAFDHIIIVSEFKNNKFHL